MLHIVLEDIDAPFVKRIRYKLTFFVVFVVFSIYSSE